MKSTKSSEAYRIIIRGTDSKGVYRRRVRVVHGTYEAAAKLADTKMNELCKGLKGVFFNIIGGSHAG